MCGIAGFLGSPDKVTLEKMLNILEHRGPDDSGIYEHKFASIGHRRLSIIDLSSDGHQPMARAKGKLQIAYNGELYNFRELRSQLESEGLIFKTNCDTEVFLAAYEHWGTDAFAKFNGMWAAAIVDTREDEPKLILVRDHYGIKPLYTATAGHRKLFASEIKALLASPELITEPNPQWFYDYLLHGLHDHRLETSFKNVTQVTPGTWEIHTPNETKTGTYWTPTLHTNNADDPEIFRQMWKKSIERRLVADVPVGTCLSGGIDSSSIVCMENELVKEKSGDAKSLGNTPNTFSIVYPGDPIDERNYIDAVLKEVDVKPWFGEPKSSEWIREVHRMAWHQDEPIVSSAPYAQFRVMQLAKPHVTVLLNGQAGDELLAGYVPYQMVYLRELKKKGLWNELVKEAWASRDVLMPLIKRKLNDRRRNVQIRPLLRDQFIKGLDKPKYQRSQDDLKQRLMEDVVTFSLPSLLRYEDRNSMAYSMEARLPFLDQELVDWIFGLPSSAIVSDGWSRSILRRGLKGTLTEKVRTRRWKVGFTTPETRWMKKERASIQGILRSPAFASRPWWDAGKLADQFFDFCEGDKAPSPLFWRAINTELWHRMFFKADGTRRSGEMPQESLTDLGDQIAIELSDRAAAEELMTYGKAHDGKHVFAWSPIDNGIYGRIPVKTKLFEPGDDIVAGILDGLADMQSDVQLKDGDILAMGEKAVAIAQGQSFVAKDMEISPLAKFLVKFVTKTPAGIGISDQSTMELAIREIGIPRILAASAVGAFGKLIGKKGLFYKVAGPGVRSIDGPAHGVIPPYDTHAKLPPLRPTQTAAEYADAIGAKYGVKIGVSIVDANDRGMHVMGQSAGLNEDTIVSLFRDNPIGQGSERTPLCIVRKVGTLRQ